MRHMDDATLALLTNEGILTVNSFTTGNREVRCHMALPVPLLSPPCCRVLL